MKASDFITQQLLSDDEPYGSRYKSQPRVLSSIRLPVELLAWIDVLQAKGVGTSRSSVVQVLLDVAIEQITDLGVCGDASDLSAMVDGVREQLEQKIIGGKV
jgi:Arc/MetJ-type ribon-helix-helix transcriptional regulator